RRLPQVVAAGICTVANDPGDRPCDLHILFLWPDRGAAKAARGPCERLACALVGRDYDGCRRPGIDLSASFRGDLRAACSVDRVRGTFDCTNRDIPDERTSIAR